MSDIEIRTLHDPEGRRPDWPDYWLAWASGVQGDGFTEEDAIANAKARLAASVEPHPLTIAPTRNGKAIPVVVFENIGKTADTHKGSAQAYQQMGLSAAEFADVQIKQ